MNHIGNKIKALLEEKKISAATLADKLGKKNKESVYGYFKKQDLDTSILRDICKITGVKIEYFFDEIRNKETLNEMEERYINDISEIIYNDFRRHFIPVSELLKQIKEINTNAISNKGLINLTIKLDNPIVFESHYETLKDPVEPEVLLGYTSKILNDIYNNIELINWSQDAIKEIIRQSLIRLKNFPKVTEITLT